MSLEHDPRTRETSRRTLLRGLGLAGAALGAGVGGGSLLAACSSAGPGTTKSPPRSPTHHSPGARSPGVVPAGYTRAGHLDATRLVGSQAQGRATAAGITAFTTDLYQALATPAPNADLPANLVCSPFSVAVALAMVRAGARGRTGTQIDEALHARGPTALPDGLSRLLPTLEKSTGRVRRNDGSHATVRLDQANAVWAQRGILWRRSFITTLVRRYAADLELTDFKTQSAAATTALNRWVEAHTHDKIAELIPPGTLTTDTRMVLVNALYLKAPWEEPFHTRDTRHGPFYVSGSQASGHSVQVPMMHANLSGASYAESSSWAAASLPYAGRHLAMAIVVPTPGHSLPQVATELAGGVAGGLATVLGALQPRPGLTVTMPRWKFRTTAQLNHDLHGLGIREAFTNAADFTGMTDVERLKLGPVLHQAFIAVDEHGTEAAAATAAVMIASSAVAGPSPTLVADRPFLFCVYDVPTRLPLFVGHVGNPAPHR